MKRLVEAIIGIYAVRRCKSVTMQNPQAKSLKDADAAAVIFVSGSTDSTSPPRTRVFG